MNTTLLGLGGLCLAAVAAFGFAGPQSARADCPGKIACPLTGEVICRDQCPNVDSNRPDCPGRIECPLTGELVCVDQCPAGAKAETAAVDAPSCCQKRE